MKKALFSALFAALLLTGCAKGTVDPGFDETWTNVGNLIGVEPMEGFTPSENMDALGPNGLYYASFVSGEGTTITNADDEEATVYDAQVYLLIEQCRDAGTAGSEVGKWLALEKTSYGTGEEQEKTIAGQSFRILPLTSAAEGNPYTHGAAAFGSRGDMAVSVELLCRDGFEGDPEEVLTAFLAGLHYAE